ncbi:MAG: hypothetical protein R3C32_14650 [Chloroflexota bacterium]
MERQASDVQAQPIVFLAPLARRAGLCIHGPDNIGGPWDFRVPDVVLLRGTPDPVWQHTAGRSSWRSCRRATRAASSSTTTSAWASRSPLIVDPAPRTVEWFARGADAFVAADGSARSCIGTKELHAAIDGRPDRETHSRARTSGWGRGRRTAGQAGA